MRLAEIKPNRVKTVVLAGELLPVTGATKVSKERNVLLKHENIREFLGSTKLYSHSGGE